jgi:hypothetical protein
MVPAVVRSDASRIVPLRLTAFRKDRTEVSSDGSLKLTYVSGSLPALPTSSALAKAVGLESQLLGSAGRLSHPAIVKLLKIPSAMAAQR